MLKWLFGRREDPSPPIRDLEGFVEIRAFHAKVAGVTFKNDDGSNRQRIIAECDVGERVTLVPSQNPKFPEAIEVHRRSGGQLGNLDERLAGEVHRAANKGKRFTATIADLTGGTRDKPKRGVNLEIKRFEPRA